VRERLQFEKIPKQLLLILAIVLVGGIGLALQLSSRAADYSVGIEAEGGQLSGATIINDTAASQNAAVRFQDQSIVSPTYYVATTGQDTANGSTNGKHKV
jgi:hypothetical protein